MRFIFLSDSKGKDNGINEKVLTKILEKTCKLTPEPEFIVLGGDNVAGSSEQEALMEQLRRLRRLIEKYHHKKILVPVIGNHEVNNEPEDNRFEKIYGLVYGDMLPNLGPANYNRTVFYKDFEDTRLIILNAFHFGEINKITGRQLLWFQDAASAAIKNKIVFVHSPAFPTGAHLGHCLDLHPENRNTFWELVEKYNIDLVLSGHEHNYSRRVIGLKKTVCQVIAGGGGEKLKNKFRDKNGVVTGPMTKYHFVVVDIDSNGIVVSAISSEGTLLDKFKLKKF